MLTFTQYLIVESDNMKGKQGPDGKASGHVKNYILPFLSAAGKKKTIDSTNGSVRGTTPGNGEHHDPNAKYTHELHTAVGNHPAGTKVKVNHVSQDKEGVFHAHTEKHGTFPISKLKKPKSLKREQAGREGFEVEKTISNHLGTTSAGPASKGYDFSYNGGKKGNPVVRGAAKETEPQKKTYKGKDRPDVRGESKLRKGKFGQSTLVHHPKKGWSLGGNPAMHGAFKRATVTGPDGRKRSLIAHLNMHHPHGEIEKGFSTDAAQGTAEHYLNQSEINTLHVHDKDKGRGTTYTVGNTSLRNKTHLSHLDSSDLHKLDGKLHIDSTSGKQKGKAAIVHRPNQTIMRDLASRQERDPENHGDLTDPSHAARFKAAVDKHINEKP